MADEPLSIPRVPDGLWEAAQLGKLIPFIGAGASLLAGCPSWAEFADAALKSPIRDGRFTYSQLDQIRHLHPRVKLSLARNIREAFEPFVQCAPKAVNIKCLNEPFSEEELKRFPPFAPLALFRS